MILNCVYVYDRYSDNKLLLVNLKILEDHYTIGYINVNLMQSLRSVLYLRDGSVREEGVGGRRASKDVQDERVLWVCHHAARGREHVNSTSICTGLVSTY